MSRSSSIAQEPQHQTFPPRIQSFISGCLTRQEQDEIVEQIRKTCLPGRQVLWTGMERKDAQAWADKHKMQTLTTAMGPLMNETDSRCPRNNKDRPEWVTYIHGASAIFAWYISQGKLVTVLTNPPPQRFHPSGQTSFQVIELPILRGEVGCSGVGRIELVHQSVPKASNSPYQFWPRDNANRWLQSFKGNHPAPKWRKINASKPRRGFDSESAAEGPRQQPTPRIEKQNVRAKASLSVTLFLSDSQLARRQSQDRWDLRKEQKEARKMLHKEQAEEKKVSQVNQRKSQVDSKSSNRYNQAEGRTQKNDWANQRLDLRETHKQQRVALSVWEGEQMKRLKAEQKEQKVSRQGIKRTSISSVVKTGGTKKQKPACGVERPVPDVIHRGEQEHDRYSIETEQNIGLLILFAGLLLYLAS